MNVERLWSFTQFDVWIDTGDFFPNKTRGNRSIEVPYQEGWLRRNYAKSIVDWLHGRPMIALQGNHDYVMLADILTSYGAEQAVQLNAHPGTCTIDGIDFGGFSNIPYIIGEWNHESKGAELNDACHRTMSRNPQVLLTHAPPHGILDAAGKDHYGIQQLTGKLLYTPHRITHHLFGHVHEDGGKTKEHEGIKFFNSARKPQIVNIPYK